jgi:hypothetical protein
MDGSGIKITPIAPETPAMRTPIRLDGKARQVLRTEDNELGKQAEDNIDDEEIDVSQLEPSTTRFPVSKQSPYQKITKLAKLFLKSRNNLRKSSRK